MLLAAYNLVRFDHVSQLLNFRTLVPTKCRCCCTQVNDAEVNLLAVERDETTVNSQYQTDNADNIGRIEIVSISSADGNQP